MNNANQQATGCGCFEKMKKCICASAEKLCRKMQVKCAECRLEKQYSLIGKKYYDENRASPPPEYKPLIDAANSTITEINNLNQAIAAPCTDSALQSL